MKKCRYLTRDECGRHQATAQECGCLTEAIRAGEVQIVGKALRYVTGVWQIPVDAFEDAIRRHLKDECLVFQKHDTVTGKRLTNKFHASVWIREPDDEDEYDDGTVYVEMKLRGTEVIVIADSHTHDRDRRRYPRQWL